MTKQTCKQCALIAQLCLRELNIKVRCQGHLSILPVAEGDGITGGRLTVSRMHLSEFGDPQRIDKSCIRTKKIRSI